jgi:hypothetical protein
MSRPESGPKAKPKADEPGRVRPTSRAQEGSEQKGAELSMGLRANLKFTDGGTRAIVKIRGRTNDDRNTQPPEACLFDSPDGDRRLALKIEPCACLVMLEWQDGQLVRVRVDGAFPAEQDMAPSKGQRVFNVQEANDSVVLSLDTAAVSAQARFSETGHPVKVTLDRESAGSGDAPNGTTDQESISGSRTSLYELKQEKDRYHFTLRPNSYLATPEFDEHGWLSAIKIMDENTLSNGLNLDSRQQLPWTSAADAMFQLETSRSGSRLTREPPPRVVAYTRTDTTGPTERGSLKPQVGSDKLAAHGSLKTPTLLFIVGPPKTFTSSLLGLLNSSPKIFLLYESEPYATRPTKWTLRLLEQRPELRKFFAKGNEIESTYRTLYRELCAEGDGFSFFGDKIATIDDAYLDQLEKFKKIVTIRDIRTWLAKRSIREIYALDTDVVSTACQYARFLIKSRFANNVLLVRLEDTIEHLDAQIAQVSAFIGHKIKIPKRWWQSVGAYEPSDPKSLQIWWPTHPSSSSAARHLDTECEPSLHPFWDDILPIFQKYYDWTDAVSLADAAHDLSALAQIQMKYQLPWRDAFESVTEALR